VFDLVEPLLDFYYRYWFRVEQRGIEQVPAEGGALLVSNHSGALPPDAPMIMRAIRHEHPRPRPLYMLGEHWFKGYPGVGMLANKIGLVPGHPANAQRLLRDERRLALVFPEGQRGSRKLYWQRYKLRRFGRGGFVRTAMRARVPIVPVAVLGAEEAMPIFAHVPLLQRLTGLIYFPVNHAFPHFGLAAALMYLPAKFKIHFLEPVDLNEYGPDDAEDVALVQNVAEEIRARIQAELERMLSSRGSVWFG
jgi:1-acyl-sn-glycerol-3-phosphate acyltransferase